MRFNFRGARMKPMPEVLSPIDDVFESPGFSLALTEWQYARMTAHERAEQLSAQVAKRYENWELGEYSAGIEIDYAMSKSLEEFKEAFDFDDTAIGLAILRESANTAEDEAKEALLECAREQGLGQFALHGLWLHTGDVGVAQKTELKQKVTQTEADFDNLDRFIRANNGRYLTLLELGASAARIGTGGIGISDNRRLVIPVEGTAYHVSFLEQADEIRESKGMALDASDIHSIFGSKLEVKLFDTWDPLLRIDDSYDVSGVTLAAGEVLEGPPHISTEHDERNRGFYQMVFERTRAVSRLAILSFELGSSLQQWNESTD